MSLTLARLAFVTHDPFSEHAALRYDTQVNPAKKNGASGWILGLSIGAAFLVLLCGGLAVAVYFAFDGIAGGVGDVELPSRPSSAKASFQFDADQFNESLISTPNDIAMDQEILAFIQDCFEADRVGDTIPFDRDMFVQAIGTSPEGTGPLGFVDRISVHQWLDEYEPVPNKFDKYFRVTRVRFDANSKLATVDLVLYSEESQADSQRWYLVSNTSGWKVYDWQSLDFGRRMSDEYAAFVKGSVRLAPGYDLAMTQLAEADDLWDQDQRDQAIAKLKACDKLPMLAEDRSVALLRTSYVWMSWGRYKEAIDRLQKIKNPDDMWGVWPTLAICYMNADEGELAMQAALKSQSQTPEHPRTHWLMATVYKDSDRNDEAAREAILALQGCPQDQTLVEMVTGFRRPQDVPLLLRAIADGGQRGRVHGDNAQGSGGSDGWLSLADSLAYDVPWADAVVAEISSGEDYQIPRGVPALLRANQAWSKSEFDSAAENFILARDEADDTMVRDVAMEDHVDARIENDRYTELFDETDDLTKTLRTLTQWAYTDDFFGNPKLLLAALDSESLRPSLTSSETALAWSEGLAGWCRHQAGEDDVALRQITKFSDWRSRHAEEDIDDEKWLQEWIDQAIAECLLGTQRYAEVVERFPDDVGIHSQLVSDLVQQDESLLQAFLDATSNLDQPTVRLIHARLQADMATQKGEIRQADEFHRAAIKLVDDVDPDDKSSLKSTLLRQRANDIVLSRVIPNEIEIADVDNVELVSDVIAEAARLGDSKTLKAWAGRVVSSQDDSQASAAIQTRLAEQRFASGRFDEAAELLNASLRDRAVDGAVVDEDILQDVWLERQRSLYLQALLEVGKFDDALKENWESNESDSSGNRTKTSLFDDKMQSKRALVALARGDADGLTQLLSDLDGTDIASWLGGSLQRRWLVRSAGSPAFRSILEKYPQRIGYLTPEASGRLLMPVDNVISAKEIQSALRSQFDENFEIQSVNSHAEKDSEKSDLAWVAKSPSGTEVLIGWSTQTLRIARLPSSLKDNLNGPVGQVTIAILDQQSKANERLFKIAAGLAGYQGVAFSWNDESMTWCGRELNTRLEWKDRAPIEATTLPRTLIPVEEISNSDDDVFGIREWSAKLGTVDTPIAALAYHKCAGTSEAIECEVIEVDVESASLVIRATTNSVIDPLIQAGISYRVYSGNVRAR